MLYEIFLHVWFVFCAVLVITGCGSKDEPAKAANPQSKFGQVQPLIAEHCANCHDGVKQKAFDSEERWLSSKAKARIENGSMPPNKPLSKDVKDRFLASF